VPCFQQISRHVWQWQRWFPRRWQSRGGGTVFTSVCLCVWFPHDVSKTDAATDRQTWHRDVARRVLETHLFWGLKVKGHESEKHFRLLLVLTTVIDSCWCLTYLNVKGTCTLLLLEHSVLVLNLHILVLGPRVLVLLVLVLGTTLISSVFHFQRHALMAEVVFILKQTVCNNKTSETMCVILLTLQFLCLLLCCE